MVDAVVPRGRKRGRNRGLAFITFARSDCARAALWALNGADIDGRRVTVALAERRPGAAAAGERAADAAHA